MVENKEEKAATPIFRMQKMYTKDLSFENPNAPAVYITPQKQEPAVEVNLQLKNTKMDDDHWEVAIQITAKITSKEDDKTMFILEVEHAGVFLLKNIPEEHIQMVLGVDCPTLLFPFTRQIVSQVSTDGGFAPFLMEPVNFMALFQNSQKKEGADN
ncbi:protein-export protein SecB [Desulfomarina profundi]|uniref:Protein-export protein SecB n=1 Tax=Desulfomarina profundi TaxID=2772557 RepID=A0A8D5FJ26_9BACT|nr:protein-export chaperone SecB [Desulfomarina profundi]BCL62293.1 protein-export protein SecB [Desulfomarina profundi]